MTKKRLLHISEFSQLYTGYSVYSKNLLYGLYKTGKYEIAEFARYADARNPKIYNVPWTVYANLPTNEQETQQYNSNILNQFGLANFGHVVLDFHPDTCTSISDFWMDDFIGSHPLSPFYHWIYMIAADSAPHQESWVDQMTKASRLLVYSEYGDRAIRQETNDKLKAFAVTPAGTSPAYKPILNKKELRERFNINPKAFIVGMFSRNQKRKLFPDLIEGFSHFLKQHPENASNIFLYIHTSYPDQGWDIPRLIKHSGCSSNILLTYICQHCKAVLPLLFNDARRVCPVCSSAQMIMPNTQVAIPEEQLNELYNLLDIHVLLSIAEAQGMTSVEAAATGTPIMGCGYAATEDVIDHCGGYKIGIDKTFLESETHQYRVYPSIKDFVDKLNQFYKLPQSLRYKKGREAHIGALKFYNWSDTIKKWESCIDSLEPKNNWSAPPHLHQPQTQIPQLDNEMLVRWAIVNILGKPELVNSYFSHRLIRDLNYGASTRQTGGVYLAEDSYLSQQARFKPFGPREMIEELTYMCRENNYYEELRCGMRKEPPKPIIMYKKPDDNTT